MRCNGVRLWRMGGVEHVLTPPPPPAQVMTWNTIMQGYVTQGQFDKVRDVFEDMVQAGMQPTVVTWNTLLASFAPPGDWVNALDVLTKATPPRALHPPNPRFVP